MTTKKKKYSLFNFNFVAENIGIFSIKFFDFNSIKMSKLTLKIYKFQTNFDIFHLIFFVSGIISLHWVDSTHFSVDDVDRRDAPLHNSIRICLLYRSSLRFEMKSRCIRILWFVEDEWIKEKRKTSCLSFAKFSDFHFKWNGKSRLKHFAFEQVMPAKQFSTHKQHIRAFVCIRIRLFVYCTNITNISNKLIFGCVQ